MSTDATSAANVERVRQILATIKSLAGEFYRLTGKPLLDPFTLDAREMWEAPFATVGTLLVRTESKARARGALSVAEFKTVARRVWPEIP
jgi:hypothetical protein